MANLLYPKLQTAKFSNRIFELCQQARSIDDKVILFDLSRSTFITPFGITILAGTISECLRNGKTCRYRAPSNSTLRKFLSRIGFTKQFRLGEEVTDVYGTAVRLKRISAVEPLLTEQILEVIEHNVSMSQGVRDSLTMSVLETMTNVFDHSNTEFCYVCAQSYRQARNIRVCITDFGQGILASLSRVPEYNHLSGSHEAIRLALEEGVSSRENTSAGYGLTHINRFLRVNRGRMIIISGDGKVSWDHDTRKIENQTMRQFFQGTIVNMRINADAEGYYILPSEDIF